MAPTTATPLSWRSKNHTTAVAPSMPISATGARGKKWRASAARRACRGRGSPSGRAPRRGCRTPVGPRRRTRTRSPGCPSSLPSCEAAIVNAMPARYPTSTGRDNRSARAPSRRTQPTRQQRPTMSASAAASGTRSSPAATSDPSAVAVISAVVDSGPTESWRDEPRNDVHRQSADRRPQGGFGRDAGHLGVRHHLRDEVRRHGDAGQHVTAQPRPLVAADPRGLRHGLHGVRLEPVDGRRRDPPIRFRVVA